MFVVAKATGGYRPVIELSLLNKHIHTAKFRMETTRTGLVATHKDDSDDGQLEGCLLSNCWISLPPSVTLESVGHKQSQGLEEGRL